MSRTKSGPKKINKPPSRLLVPGVYVHCDFGKPVRPKRRRHKRRYRW